MNISDRLNQLIGLEKLNIKDFAKQCDIPYRSMYNYVRGEREPNLEALSKISQKFNVNLNWLITGNGEVFNGVYKELFSVEENQLIEAYRAMGMEVKDAFQIAFKAIKTYTR